MRIAAVALLGVVLAAPASASSAEAYLNPSLSLEERLDDLLARMTLREKIGQMSQYVGLRHVGVAEVEALVREGLVGSFLNVEGPAEANRLQRLAAESRLGIPLLIGVDAIHGLGMTETPATIFPSPIGLSCAWDPELLERIGRVTAAEMRATGYQWTFSPNLDVARDARWGRVGETFGEDPLLVSELGAAMVRGYQGRDLGDPESVAACAKHLIGGGEPVNGLNFAPTDVSERTLREVFLPSFQAAVDAGVATVMAAHNEVGGVPCHANAWLLRRVLRDGLGFGGFVVSDWTDVERLHTLHRVARDVKEAVTLAVSAGIDMHMHGPGFLEPLEAAVKEGKVPWSRIDEAARAILAVKLRLGLFERRYVDETLVARRLLTGEHRAVSLEAARESIVLLKNEANLLPLARTTRILLTGPNADAATLLGDWVRPQPDDNVVTVLEGVRALWPAGQVEYSDCGPIREIGDSEIRAAAERAKHADVAVVVVGGDGLRYHGEERTSGENVARSSLRLFGRQLDLVRAVWATGTPTVVVFVNGRPLAEPWIEEHVPAIVEAWEPGMLGGRAVAEVLSGELNPSGKLSISFPRSAGHIQTVYDHKPSQFFRKYVDADWRPLYEFGHGLSYTRFEYSALKVPARLRRDQDLEVAVEVRNAGERAGDEVVLVFVRDLYASVTTPVRRLAAFGRVSLLPGQQETVRFTIPARRLAILDSRLQPVVEPGGFELSVGGLQKAFEVVG